jgi:recombinational DNA repair protein RecT
VSTDKAIAKKDEAQTPADRALGWMMAQVEKRGARLENLLHPDMPLERFKESCRLAFAKNPDLTDLSKTDGASLMQALMLGARSGLDVHGHYGHLVSFQNKKFAEGGKDVWKAVIVFMPDYRGMLATAKAAGCVLDAEPVLVYEADEFRPTGGADAQVHHVPFIRRKPADVKGSIIAAYTRFLLPSGQWVVKGLMLLEDIERIEGGIKAKNGPWGSAHRPRMILKTSFRQAWPWLGISTTDRAVAMRLAALEEAEAIEGEYTVTTPAPVAPISGVERTKQAARKALAPKSQELDARDFINPEPSEEEKAAILAADLEPGSSG